jgi:hypothetical protein
MEDNTKNGMQCTEFDALLSEALDQTLTGARLEAFQAHLRACPQCGPLFAEVETGRGWLKQLQEIEPPPFLVQDILADTVGIDTARLSATAAAAAAGPTWFEKLQEQVSGFFGPIAGVVMQPRFALSFGMVFFSLTLAMSLAGVKASDLAQVDLRPSALKRTYYTTTGRVVKYYENIRFVYEIESRVREFKKAATPAEPGPEAPKQQSPKNNTSGEPEQKQERNFSQSSSQVVLASAGHAPTVVTVTTNRRFV